MSGVSDNWHVFGGELLEETVFNLRFIDDESGPAINKVFYGKELPNVEQFQGVLESTIHKINNQGYKSYINLNPIEPDFDGYAAKDKDISTRRRFLVDIDGKKRHTTTGNRRRSGTGSQPCSCNSGVPSK